MARKRTPEQQHMDRVAAMGCVVCRNKQLADDIPPCSPHHIRHGYGASDRAPDWHTIPLCHIHHQAGHKPHVGEIHYAYHRSPEKFEELYGSEVILLIQTQAEIISRYGNDAIPQEYIYHEPIAA